MTPRTEMLSGAIDQAGAFVVWAFLVVGGLTAVFVLSALFLQLALRRAWRWFTRASWNTVLLSAERKAFRQSGDN